MKLALLIILLNLMCATYVWAQGDSIKTSKNELLFLTKEFGFSTDMLYTGTFDSEAGYPIQFMFKKINNGRWIRWGLSVSAYRYTHHHGGSGFHDIHAVWLNSYNGLTITPSLGIEKRKKLSSRWTLLYGLDGLLITGYQMNSQKSETMSNINNSSVHQTYYSIGAGISTFFGITYKISPRFYLSTESAAGFSTNLGKKYEKYDSIHRELDQYENYSWGASIGVRPASSIFVYYRF